MSRKKQHVCNKCLNSEILILIINFFPSFHFCSPPISNRFFCLYKFCAAMQSKMSLQQRQHYYVFFRGKEDVLRGTIWPEVVFWDVETNSVCKISFFKCEQILPIIFLQHRHSVLSFVMIFLHGPPKHWKITGYLFILPPLSCCFALPWSVPLARWFVMATPLFDGNVNRCHPRFRHTRGARGAVFAAVDGFLTGLSRMLGAGLRWRALWV